MTSLRDEIHKAVVGIAQQWKYEATLISKGISKGLLPIILDGEQEELHAYITQWLTSKESPVAILTAPLGSGKTMATSMLPERLEFQGFNKKVRDGIVLWIPFLDADFTWEADPNKTIIDLLRSKNHYLKENFDLWSNEADIRLIILDGLDEAISKSRYIYGHHRNVITWLNTLLERAERAVTKPRILICGRDVILEPSVIEQDLLNVFQPFCELRLSEARMISKELIKPLYLRLKAWRDDEIRYHLEKELEQNWGTDMTQRLISLVRPGILTSPLLFGLAYDVLTKIAEKESVMIFSLSLLIQRRLYQLGSLLLQDYPEKQDNNSKKIDNEWDLISTQITKITARNIIKHHGVVSIDSCKEVAEYISLFLCLSGRENIGLEIQEIEQELKKLEQELKKINPEIEKRGLFSLEKKIFENNACKLKTLCLLRERNSLFSIFHDIILIHLSAEALESFVQKYQTLEIKIDNLTQKRTPFLNELSQLFKRPGLPILIELLSKIININAIQGDSSFPEVLNYWIRYKWNLSDISFSQLPSFRLTPTLHSEFSKKHNKNLIGKTNKDIDPIRELIVFLYNGVLQANFLDTNEQKNYGSKPAESIIDENKDNDIPVIVLSKEAIVNINIKHLLDNCIEQNITTPIEQGILDENTTTFYLPNSTQEQAIKIFNFIAKYISNKGVIPKNHITIENRKFRNYLINFLYIQVDGEKPIDSEIQNISSTTQIQLIAEEIIANYSQDLGLNHLDYQDLKLDIFLVNQDGTVSNLDSTRLLEEYQICTGDILIINIKHPEVNNITYSASTDSGSMRSAIPIQTGSMPIWHINEDGNRQITTINISQNIYIAEQPVSVRDYASFLRANPESELPNQPEANWQRLNDQIVYNQELENDPVTGINRSEAEEYLEWLRHENAESNATSSNYLYQLPRPEWLQTATLGNKLKNPSADGSGSYGHQNITGSCWQWTTRKNDSKEALVFGGSKTLGNEIEGGAQKALMRGYPDLCRRISAEIRDPQIGFRIGIIVPGEKYS